MPRVCRMSSRCACITRLLWFVLATKQASVIFRGIMLIADNYGVSLIKFTCLSVFRVVRVRIGDGLINQLIGHSN